MTVAQKLIGLSRGAFTPSQITGLVGWYDFSDISTLWKDTSRTSAVTTTGDTIGGVTDKSGTANHLAQAAANKPAYTTNAINSKSASRSTAASGGTLLLSAFTQAQPFTIVTVVKQRSAVGGGSFSGIWGASGGSIPQAAFQGTSTVYRVVLGNVVATTATWDTTNPHIFTVAGNGASSNVRVDSVDQTLNAGTQGWVAEELQIGASPNNGDADIGEVLVYNSVLSAGNLTAVDTYLKAKWGTP